MSWLPRTLAILIALYWASPATAAILNAKVTGGIVTGAMDQGVSAFKGIPFAAPPVGQLRWKAPQPVIPWRGVRNANAFAEPCPQTHEKQIQGSEDCLYLNVWTNAATRHEKRPVLVWIYGGGFNAGATSNRLYNGSNFARDGVVLVSIAYRLGVLGFLAHPELSRESGHGSGTFGLQDQIAALRWVKANISEFGGDPDRVTIIGQSSGAISVSFLTAAPAARGLFRYAIAQSGGAFLQPPQRVEHRGGPFQSLEYAEWKGQQFLETLDAVDISHARQIPTQQLLLEATKWRWSWWVVVDGGTLPDENFTLYPQGRFIDTPILIGFNSDDRHEEPPSHDTVAWFEDYVAHNYGQCPSMVRTILAAYPHSSDTEAAQAWRNLFVDTWYGGNAWTWARLHSHYGHSSTYVYYFDIPNSDQPQGAFHAAELPHVFGDSLLHRYWINFATRGDPNGSGLPAWPQFTEQEQNAMILDTAPAGRPLPHTDRMKIVEQYYDCVRSGGS